MINQLAHQNDKRRPPPKTLTEKQSDGILKAVEQANDWKQATADQ